MDQTSLVLTAVIPIFLVIVLGYGARRVHLFTEAAETALIRVITQLLYPCLILSFVIGNPALQRLDGVCIPPLIGFTSTVIGYIIGLIAFRWLCIGSKKDRHTFAFCTGLPNYGYFPIPIVAQLFDHETMGILLVYNIGVEIALWSVGVGCLIANGPAKGLLLRIMNPPIIALIIGLMMNFSGLAPQIPSYCMETFELLGNCAIPLGLLLIGASFYALLKTDGLQMHWRIPLVGMLLRMALFPLLFGIFIAYNSLPLALNHVLVVQAAMPCAVFPIVLTRLYQGSTAIACKLALSTTLLGLISIPLWIHFGLRVCSH
jgi:predicted permease